MKRFAFAFTALAFSAGISGAAHACSSGFIADTLCKWNVINQETAQAADALHDALGNPIEKGVAAALDTYVAPGAGGAYLATQGIGSGSRSSAQASPFVQDSRAPQPAWTPPLPQLGNLCMTMTGYYPGPFTPVGMPCTAYTPWGLQGGVVVN